MTTVIIEDKSPEAKKLLDYIKTLPYVMVMSEKKKIREAAIACNAVTPDIFIGKLNEQIDEYCDLNA